MTFVLLEQCAIMRYDSVFLCFKKASVIRFQWHRKSESTLFSSFGKVQVEDEQSCWSISFEQR